MTMRPLAPVARSLVLAALALAFAACSPSRQNAASPHSAAVATSLRPAADPSSPTLAASGAVGASGASGAAVALGAAGASGATAGAEAETEGEAPLPPGFVRMLLPLPPSSGPIACGRFRVENVFDDPTRFEPRVVVRDEQGRRVYEARGRRYQLGGPGEPEARMALLVDSCGDLTGDGVPELVMTESTVGAHCCYTHYVVSLTATPRRLLMWEKGDGLAVDALLDR